MPTFGEAGLLELSAQTAQLAGEYQIDDSSVVYAYNPDQGESSEFTVTANGGHIDIHVSVDRLGEDESPEEMPMRFYDGYGTFEGLLTTGYGIHLIGDTHTSHITVVSTPLALNTGLEKLDRTPGVDAPTFLEGRGGRFPAAIWLPHLSLAEIVVADREHWDVREGDLVIDDHPADYYSRTEQIWKGIRNGSEELELEYGELEPGNEPQEVLAYVDAEENFIDHTGPIGHRVFKLTQAAGAAQLGRIDSSPAVIHALERMSVDDAALGFGPDGQTQGFLRYAQMFGLVDRYKRPEEKRENLIMLGRSVARTVSLSLLKANEIRLADEADPTGERQERMRILSAIGDSFPATA